MFTKLLRTVVLLVLQLIPLHAGLAFGQAGITPKDQHGDALPAGAVARLGTVRWRHGGMVEFVAFVADRPGEALRRLGVE
jgi:hypothetical protein